MIDRQVLAAAKTAARRLGCETAALVAAIEVESAGRVYAVVAGHNEPLIRIEGHYFDRRLTGATRDKARRAGLAHPNAGVVKNPPGQSERWAMLNRMIAIDAVAALESTSWGVGQVMGAHWQWLGYGAVDDLVNVARAGVTGQIELMVRYIEKAGLTGALKRRDWAAFARGYNGRDFARHGYHTKLAAAYRRHAGAAASSAPPSSDGMLRLGSSGARVRELQTLLVRAGQAVTVDGDFGPATATAVRGFQSANDIEVDGVAGPETMRAFDRFRQGIADRPGAQSPGALKDVRDGLAGGLGGGLATEAARQQVSEAADRLAWVPGLEWASAALAVLAAALVIGGLVWAAWGWWHSRRTVERPS
ncbi:N-acetylmuramidase domain-containing protein [Nitratireductor soli]|uniref:N-acetylmuramidase domain-containing protein n=1 Tax=Nitratireductor soli TaxID=1670619 RepID=UPI0009E5CF47|nr:N-acetylmuramidase domain-containing protein [Nitratireductor soli]